MMTKLGRCRAALLLCMLASGAGVVGGLRQMRANLPAKASWRLGEHRLLKLHVAPLGNDDGPSSVWTRMKPAWLSPAARTQREAAIGAHRTTLEEAMPTAHGPEPTPLADLLGASVGGESLQGLEEVAPAAASAAKETMSPGFPELKERDPRGALHPTGPEESSSALDVVPHLAKDTGSKAVGESWQDNPLFYKALLVLVAVFWGTNFPAVRFIEGFDVSSSSLAALRFGIAGLVLAPTLIGQPRDLLLAGLECGLWAAAGYVAQAIGLEVVQANKAAFLCSLHVVLVPFLSALFGIADVKGRQWVAAVLALLGVGLLEGAGSSLPSASDALLLLQPLGFGMSYIKIEEAAKRFPGGCTALSAAQMLSIALVSLGWMAVDCFNGVSPSISAIASSPTAIGAVLYTGLITTALTVYLQTLALEKVSATDMTVIISTEPLVAAGVSVVALGERLSSLGILGGAIIFGTCLWSQLTEGQGEESATEQTL